MENENEQVTVTGRMGKGLVVVLAICGVVWAAVKLFQRPPATAPGGGSATTTKTPAEPGSQKVLEGEREVSTLPPIQLIQEKKPSKKIEGKAPPPPKKPGQ